MSAVPRSAGSRRGFLRLGRIPFPGFPEPSGLQPIISIPAHFIPGQTQRGSRRRFSAHRLPRCLGSLFCKPPLGEAAQPYRCPAVFAICSCGPRPPSPQPDRPARPKTAINQIKSPKFRVMPTKLQYQCQILRKNI